MACFHLPISARYSPTRRTKSGSESSCSASVTASPWLPPNALAHRPTGRSLRAPATPGDRAGPPADEPQRRGRLVALLQRAGGGQQNAGFELILAGFGSGMFWDKRLRGSSSGSEAGVGLGRGDGAAGRRREHRRSQKRRAEAAAPRKNCEEEREVSCAEARIRTMKPIFNLAASLMPPRHTAGQARRKRENDQLGARRRIVGWPRQSHGSGWSGGHQRGFRLESCLVGDFRPSVALCGRAAGCDLCPVAAGFLWSALCPAFSAFSCFSGLAASCLRAFCSLSFAAGSFPGRSLLPFGGTRFGRRLAAWEPPLAALPLSVALSAPLAWA